MAIIKNNYAYLLKEFAKRHVEYISFRGMGTLNMPSSIGINDIYIDLGYNTDAFGKPLQNGIGRSLLEKFIDTHNAVVLIGKPGSGKTFFIKHILSDCNTEKELPSLSNRWPLYFSLQDYINSELKNFHDFLCQCVYNIVGKNDKVFDWLKVSISKGEVFLIIDDLDIAAFHSEKEIIKSIENFLDMFLSFGNKVLLTSRIIGYRDVRLKLSVTQAECYISDFSDDDILRFARKWNSYVLKQQDVNDTLLNLISISVWNHELATNPGILTKLAVMVSNIDSDQKIHEIEILDMLINSIISGKLSYRDTAFPIERINDRKVIYDAMGYVSLKEIAASGNKRGFSILDLVDRLKETLKSNNYEANMLMDIQLREPFSMLLRQLNEETFTILYNSFRYYFIGYSFEKMLQNDLEEAKKIIIHLMKRGNLDSVGLAVTSAMMHAMSLGINQEEILSKISNLSVKGLTIGPIIEAFVISELDMGLEKEIMTSKLNYLLECLTDRRLEPVLRQWVGTVLSRIGDPRNEVISLEKMQFCEISSGAYYFNLNDSNQWNIQYDYYLGRFPITWCQFMLFANTDAYKDSKYYPDNCKCWLEDEETHALPFVSGELSNANQPVIAITWYEAYAFCNWLTEIAHNKGWLPLDWIVRLPYEDEWVKGARGGEYIPAKAKNVILEEFQNVLNAPLERNSVVNPAPKRKFVWENNEDEPEIAICLFGIRKTTTVGMFPSSKSPYGCEEMNGNVWEWLGTAWGNNWDTPHDLHTRMRQKNFCKNIEEIMMVKGGSFLVSEGKYSQETKKHLEIDYLTKNYADIRHVTHGFRICIAPVQI